MRYGFAVNLGRGAKVVVLLAAVVGVCAGVKLAAPVLIPCLLALFVTTVTAPLALWLAQRGVPRSLAVIVAILLDLGAVAGFVALVATSVTSFYQKLPQYQQQLTNLFQQTYVWLASYGIDVPTRPFNFLGDPRQLVSVITTLIGSIASAATYVLLVLLIVVFMLFETVGLRAKLARVLTQESLARVAGAAREVNKYLLVKTATSLATGILVGIWCVVWHVDLPLLWGLLAFLLNFIPNVGSIIAAIPPVLLALLDEGLAPAMAVAAGFLGVNFTIGNIIEPRVMGRALGMSSLVVFLSIVFWGWLLGPVGALLSVPLTMVLKIFLANTEDGHWIAVMLEPVHPTRHPPLAPADPAPANVGPAAGARADSSTP